MPQGHRSYERVAWTDRFNTPTTDALRGGLPSAAKHLFDKLRARIKELDGIEESFVWHGDCWRWTIEYRTANGEEPVALLVPCPTDLQLAMPVSREFLNMLASRRLKRAVRDGLDLATEPFDNRWGVWSINACSILDDLQDIIELRLSQLAKRAV